MSQYPSWNDNAENLIKKICENTAEFADTLASDVSKITAGTGISVSPAGGTGNVTVTNTGATSILGTANQIIASAATGAVTLSFPNDVTLFPAPLNAVNVAAGITPSTEWEVDSTSTSSPRGIMSAQFNTGTDGARFHGRKARGTRAVPLTVAASDNLTRYVASGYDSANYLEMGTMTFGVPSGATVAATRVPTEWTLQIGTNATPSVLTTTALFSSTTGIALTALGTNQSITLTPSGTGQVIGQFSTNKVVVDQGTLGQGAIFMLATATATSSTNFAFTSNGANTEFNAPNGYLQFDLANVAKMRIAATTGNLLLGGLITDGTGVLQFPGVTVATWGATALASIGVSADTTAGVFTFTAPTSGSFNFTKKVSSYNGVATAGWGVPAVQADGNIAATTNARSAAVATYTVGAADGTFVVSGAINVTTSTTFSFSLDCVYTDDGNTSRTLVLPLTQLAGTFVVTGLATNVLGGGPYESASMTIRAKAGTTITIRPSAGGTYTAVVYNVCANIRQIG